MIASALEGEDLSDIAAQITALMQADQGLVSTAAAQTFTPTEKAVGRANIDAASQADMTQAQENIATNANDIASIETAVGNTDHNFVTDFDNTYNA